MHYKALVVVSPCESEVKEQDAAKWYSEENVACVCDGVSTSPHAAEAAIYISSQIQNAFNGNLIEKVRNLCSELKSRRKNTLTRPIKYGTGVPSLMKDQLSSLINKKRENSYQTTAVAIKLSLEWEKIRVELFQCGDSAFFVFEKGDCIFTTVAYEIEKPKEAEPVHQQSDIHGAKTVKLVLADFWDKPSSASPKKQYRFTHDSSSTHVLPDSFLSGQYKNLQMYFPQYSHFLLASDGFYDGFVGSADLLEWLEDNWISLQNPEKQREVMSSRHKSLMAVRGDDDISFIWLYPDTYKG